MKTPRHGAKPSAVVAWLVAISRRGLALGLAVLALCRVAAAGQGRAWHGDGSASATAAICAGKKICLCAGANACYAVLAGGGVFRSVDGGAAWAVCATQPAGRQVFSLALDGAGRLYAEGAGGMSVSADGCASWTALGGGQP